MGKKGESVASGVDEAATHERVNIHSNILRDNQLDSAATVVTDNTTNHTTNEGASSRGNTLENAKDRLVPLVDGAVRKANWVAGKVKENTAKFSSGKRGGESIQRSAYISENDDSPNVAHNMTLLLD